jgi:hypothetical protein
MTIVLSMLMSLVQTGADPAVLLGDDVRAVIEAALRPPARRADQSARRRRAPRRR